MKKNNVLSTIIDVLAYSIVIEWFLKYIGISRLNERAIYFADWIFIGVLFLDLARRFKQSTDKSQFMKEHIFEFIALIPIHRVFRLFRVFRIIRRSKMKNFFKMVRQMLKTNGLFYVIIVVILLTLIGGGLLYRIENDIATLQDGIWFSFVTMTTVGYGDFTATTATGRIISVILMVVGIGFLGILTGTLASFFTKHTKKKKGVKTVDISDLSEDDQHMVMTYIDFVRSKS